jgi:hypothetical protein
MAQARVQGIYEDDVKKAQARVAKVQSQLKSKYGRPTSVIPHKFTNTQTGVVERRIDDLEWVLDGLHVRYDAERYEDTVLIELDSVYRSRIEGQRKQEAAEPKL